jgi:hypothetical protein
VNRPKCKTSLIAIVIALGACQPVTEYVGTSPALPGCSTGGRRGSGGAAVASGGHAGSSAGAGGGGAGGAVVVSSGGQPGIAGAGVAGSGVAGSGIAGSGVAGAAGGPAASGGDVGSGGMVASGGVVGSGGVVAAGGAGGGSAGGAGGAIATQLGWIPCAVAGDKTCDLPAGTVRVRYGDGADAGDHFITKTVTNSAPASIACQKESFGGSNPNPCNWCNNYCWYEGQVTMVLPAGQLTGPQINLPVTVTPYPGYSQARVMATTDTGTRNNTEGDFREFCTFSKFDFQDPIVFPGQPEASHLHLFFGNTVVTEASTPASIQTTGNSTCAGGTLNRSAYWVPAMIDTVTHQPIRPTENLTYYKTGLIPTSEIHALPEGLVMVTGNSKNTLPGVNPVRFGCVSPSAVTPWSDHIPACPDMTYELEAEFTFQQCWDGVHLDSPDHKSHMGDATGVYPVFHCPPDHPVALPLISYNIRWPTFPNGSASYRLSSDNYPANGLNGGYSGHADYMVGWDRATIDKFTTYCLQASADCHAYLLGNGQILY